MRGAAPDASNRKTAGQPGQSLESQLTLVVLLPVLLLGAVVALVSAYALRQVSLNLILQRNTALVQVAADSMANDLKGYVRPLEGAAAALARAPDTQARQAQVFDAWAPFFSGFDGGVTLVDAGGDVAAATSARARTVMLSDPAHAFYQAARTARRPVYSSVSPEGAPNQALVVATVPVVRSNGAVEGALAGLMSLSEHAWAEELAPLRSQEGAHVYLIDAAGNLVYHPDGQAAGEHAALDRALGQWLAGPDAHSQLYRSPTFRRDVIASFAPLPDVGWSLVMEEPWDSIIAPALPYVEAMSALLVLGAITSLLVLLASMRRVTRPLRTLAHQAELVSGGAAFQPQPVEGPSELRALITAFNQMVVRLAEQRSALRAYAAQVLRSQEEERKRLARELHDETVQQMVGLVQRIELCRNELARDPAAAARRLDELQGLAKDAAAGVRRMSNDLRPLILEDLGLPVAVQSLCDDLAAALPQAQVHCEIVGDERRLGPEVELTVFRVAQEALTNVRKHAAGATQVNATLYYEKDEIVATVEDNGPGFPPGDVSVFVRAGHLGLAGMYERVALFGGTLEIGAPDGCGAMVTIRLPG